MKRKYRKLPVEIEAMLYDGNNGKKVSQWCNGNGKQASFFPCYAGDVEQLVIHTLEGAMMVSDGDYIIKGMKGEFYPCKPDVFKETYEEV